MASGNYVIENDVTNSGGAGILVGLFAESNYLEGSVMVGNADGMLFGGSTNDNVFRRNLARGSTGSDFSDAGTANTSHGDNYLPGLM